MNGATAFSRRWRREGALRSHQGTGGASLGLVRELLDRIAALDATDPAHPGAAGLATDPNRLRSKSSEARRDARASAVRVDHLIEFLI